MIILTNQFRGKIDMIIKHPSQIDNADDFKDFLITDQMRNNVQMMTANLGTQQIKRRRKKR